MTRIRPTLTLDESLEQIHQWVISRLDHLSKSGDPEGCLALMAEYAEWIDEEECEIMTLSHDAESGELQTELWE